MIAFTGFTQNDFDEPHLDRVNEIVRQLVLEVNRLGGNYGTIALLDHVDMGGNRIMNVGTPPIASPPTSNPPAPQTGSPTPSTGTPPTGVPNRPTLPPPTHDVINQELALSMFGPDAVAAQMEATGNAMLQTARRLNDGTQQEKSSTFLISQSSVVPCANTSSIAVAAAGANSTITVTAGTATFSDKSTKKYSQRIDTVANPGAGSVVYFYYLRTSDKTLQVTGPFTQNNAQNQIQANSDGREFIGTATVNAGGGGTGGGGIDISGGGCVEIGTPVSFYQGTISVKEEAEACEDWADIALNDGRKLSVHPDTLVSVFIKAKDLLTATELFGVFVEVDTGGMAKAKSVVLGKRKSVKIKRQVIPLGVYAANGIRLHNVKPRL